VAEPAPVSVPYKIRDSAESCRILRRSGAEAAGIRDGGKTPLFRSAAGRTGTLTGKPMNRVDAWRMIQRRAAELGMRIRIGCHTFRATGITAYLEAGGTLENAQAMAAHESPRTTKLYDCTGDEITFDEIERISI
jgi:integrase